MNAFAYPASLPSPLLASTTISDLQAIADLNPSLAGYLQGYIAEQKLMRVLLDVPGVDSVSKIPDSSSVEGDLLVQYKGVPLYVECKSTRKGSYTAKNGGSSIVRCRKSHGRRRDGASFQSMLLSKASIDVLAVCMYPSTKRWDFVSAISGNLPEHVDHVGYIAPSFVISQDSGVFSMDLASVLDAAVSHKIQSTELHHG